MQAMRLPPGNMRVNHTRYTYIQIRDISDVGKKNYQVIILLQYRSIGGGQAPSPIPSTINFDVVSEKCGFILSVLANDK